LTVTVTPVSCLGRETPTASPVALAEASVIAVPATVCAAAAMIVLLLVCGTTNEVTMLS
jgi:hypothetical protein